MEATTFVGLDVHKRTTSVAIAEAGRGGEVRFPKGGLEKGTAAEKRDHVRHHRPAVSPSQRDAG